MNWNTFLSEKDRLYLNQGVSELGRAFEPVGTCHVPINTPRVPNGPLGC